MRSKSMLTVLVLVFSATMLFGVAAIMPTAEAPYMPVSELSDYEIVGDITAEFVSKDDDEKTKETAYAVLLEAARAQYGENVSVGDIVWESNELVAHRKALSVGDTEVGLESRQQEANVTKPVKNLRAEIANRREVKGDPTLKKTVALEAVVTEASESSFNFTATAKVVIFPAVDNAQK